MILLAVFTILTVVAASSLVTISMFYYNGNLLIKHKTFVYIQSGVFVSMLLSGHLCSRLFQGIAELT